MPIQTIKYGAAANDGTGDSLREAMRKSQGNFDYLDQTKADAQAMTQALAGKVSNEAGKSLMTDAEHTKLGGIAEGAQVNVATNLALGTATANSRIVTSSTGGSVTLPAATSSTAGLMTAAETSKLGTVSANATANSSDAFLLARENQSGTQPISTVVALTDALRGMRNVVINGDFRINQRNYTSGAATTANQYTLDRWKVTGTGGITFPNPTNRAIVTIPVSQTIQQIIEGLNIDGGTYVLSWEGTAKGRINTGAYGNSGAVKATLTAGANVTVQFNTGTVTNVQLEIGDVATPFEKRNIGTELALCKRYLEYGYLSVCSDGVTSYLRAITQMSETKRVNPTFILKDNGGNVGKCSADAENGIAASPGGNNNYVSFNVNNVIRNVNVFFSANWEANAEL